MRRPPADFAEPPAPPGTRVRHVPAPDPAWYLDLYNRVGAAHTWTYRKLLAPEALAAILADPRNEVHHLEAGGASAGYVELDRRTAPDTVISYFGLVGPFQGRGLGRFLLDWAIRRAWREHAPQALRVQTCTLDGPAALPLYLKLGFEVVAERDEFVDLI